MNSEYEDDDGPSEQAAPIYTESSAQALAGQWAMDVLKKNPQVKDVDRPYVQAVLTELAFFERPLKELACGINVNDDVIVVTVKGYKNLLNDKAWWNVFLSPQRSDELKRVTDTFTQTTDQNGVIKVVHISRVVLQNSVRRGGATASSIGRRRK